MLADSFPANEFSQFLLAFFLQLFWNDTCKITGNVFYRPSTLCVTQPTGSKQQRQGKQTQTMQACATSDAIVQLNQSQEKHQQQNGCINVPVLTSHTWKSKVSSQLKTRTNRPSWLPSAFTDSVLPVPAGPTCNETQQQLLKHTDKTTQNTAQQQQQQQRPFNGHLSGTTRVGRYQKKHSPTHTHPDHRASFIIFLHLQRSMASSLFNLRA